MPIKRPPLVNEEVYHIVIRGVGDSVIFRDKDDYYRGIFSLFEFNDAQPVSILKRRRARLWAKKGGQEQFSSVRKPLVEILAFCFMPNHIHLLLRQKADGGITKFMRKLGAGYAAYFNKKYTRRGHLFQARFYAVHIKNEVQLKTAFVYIHCNSISLVEPNWKEVGIKNPKKITRFLENYKWSSYQDYIGKKNFPSVTERESFSEVMGREKECRDFVDNWIRHKKELWYWDQIALE